jgi:chitin synthase
MELVLVRNLCGIFCFSMQFVILVELIGTIVLPAALTFTVLMIIDLAKSAMDPSKILPLAILLFIIFLPGLLVLCTTRKLVYVYWFFIYILALPIWNFALPMYAFWHMDDFSWGATRAVHGSDGKNKDHHGDESNAANPNGTLIVRKKWIEWERYQNLYLETIERMND